MTIELIAPDELREQLRVVLPRLAKERVSKLHAFADSRPGEPPFWCCFLFVDGRRHSVGTPDLRELPLADQVPNLLHQLRQFHPTTLPERFLALTAVVAAMTTDEEREKAIRDFIDEERRIEVEHGDPQGLLPLFDHLEAKFLHKRYSVSDDELVERVRNAPDMGGTTLVELTALQREVEDSGAADQLRLFTRGETG